VLLEDQVEAEVSPAGELVVRIGDGDASAETELVTGI